MKNIDQGLIYITLDLPSAKLYIFIDRSFANNKDLSSLIRFKIILVNKTIRNEEFSIRGNLLY